MDLSELPGLNALLTSWGLSCHLQLEVHELFTAFNIQQPHKLEMMNLEVAG